MFEQTELDHREPRDSGGPGTSDLMPVMLALAASIFFGMVLWLWNTDLLWMLAVLLPPIWSPVIARRVGQGASPAFRRVTVIGLAGGLVVLLAVLVIVFVMS